MKTVWNGAGLDNTANAKLWLLQNRNMYIQDLYQLGPGSPTSLASIQVPGVPPDPNVPAPTPWLYQWTDADYPIKSTYLGATFYPEPIKRGTLKYKVGLQASELQFELYTRDIQQPWGAAGQDTSGDPGLVYPSGTSNPLTGPRGYPPYEDPAMTYKRSADGKGGWGLANTLKLAFAEGDMAGLPFTLYRAFMPTPGDADTIGIAVMFTGYITKCEIGRSKISITVASLIQAFQTKVPTQLIEPGDRGWSYDPKINPDYYFSVHNTSTPSVIHAFSGIVGTGSPPIGDGSGMTDGSLLYFYDNDPRDVAPWQATKWNTLYQRRIRTATFNATDNFYYIYLFDPLPMQPWSLSIEHDRCYVFLKRSMVSGTSGRGPGFPYVPPPEAAV